MDILVNKYRLGNNNPNSPSGEENIRQDIVEKLISFFILTEEDRLKAGIYVGKEGRDWIDRSALIVPPIFKLE
jgi:hypothetical protein